jgi:two-component sensor histidine kinase
MLKVSASDDLRDRSVEPEPVSAEQVLRAISGSRVVIFNQDLDLRYRWVQNPTVEFAAFDFVGKTDDEILPEAAAKLSIEIKQLVMETGESQTFDLPVVVDDSIRFFEVCVHRDVDKDGKPSGVIGSAIDVTYEREQARSLAALILEVSHRSRNLLAIVQSMAVQTARSESSIDIYCDRFVGRLQSLSRSQDIITASDWQGADADGLVQAQLDGFIDGERLSIKCADISFAPSAALYVGLAIHELAASAGHALEDRRISIELTQTGDEEHPVLLHWREQTDGQVRSFGTFAKSILERATPRAVDGEAELDVTDRLLSYRLRIGGSALHGRS